MEGENSKLTFHYEIDVSRPRSLHYLVTSRLQSLPPPPLICRQGWCRGSSLITSRQADGQVSISDGGIQMHVTDWNVDLSHSPFSHPFRAAAVIDSLLLIPAVSERRTSDGSVENSWMHNTLKHNTHNASSHAGRPTYRRADRNGRRGWLCCVLRGMLDTTE